MKLRMLATALLRLQLLLHHVMDTSDNEGLHAECTCLLLMLISAVCLRQQAMMIALRGLLPFVP